MKYERANENYIVLDFGVQNPKEIILAIAKHSYETAQPRGLGCLQPHETHSSKVDFRQFIEYKPGLLPFTRVPIQLLMDYVNGRDCRTKVTRQSKNIWQFDAQVFEQREGIRLGDADKFLEEIICKLIKGE